MHRTPLTVLMLLAVALAGCSDDDSPAPDDGSDPAMTDGPAPLEAPTWAVGDFWTYETSFGTTWNLVVTANGSSDYTVDTDDPNLAFFHDQNEVSYLGDVRKSDLAGSQGNDRVRYYAFPLEDGKTWTTPWDGVAMTITATRVSDQVYTFEAFWEDLLIYTYRYDAADRSLSDFRGYDGNGTETFTLDLVDSGTGFTGEFVRVDASIVAEEAGTGPTATVETLSIPAVDDGDLYLNFQVQCPSVVESVGAPFAFAIGPAENIPGAVGAGVEESDDGYNFASPCPLQASFSGVIGQEPNSGTWGYSLDAPDPDQEYSFQLWLREFERLSL